MTEEQETLKEEQETLKEQQETLTDSHRQAQQQIHTLHNNNTQLEAQL